MRNIFILIVKEFKQIFRNKAMLAIIFLMPLIQQLVLSNAADFEIKTIAMSWEDYDNSPLSKALLQKFTSNGFFVVSDFGVNVEQNDMHLGSNKADIVISIPEGFERDLVNHRRVDVQLRINAIDGMVAGLISSYANRIIASFYQSEFIDLEQGVPVAESRYLYNPQLNYKTFMVPGIIVILVSVIGLLLTALNIAREKEIGTIEQINVTPIKKYQFILGKLIPMLIIGLVEFLLCILIAIFVFHVPFIGSFLLELLFLIIYLALMLGIGLLVSTRAQTQQQAMFIGFFILMVFVFLSGLFTAVENMPAWGQIVSAFIPISYFVRDTRAIMLKGAGIGDLYPDLLVLTFYAIVVNILATLAYRKTTD